MPSNVNTGNGNVFIPDAPILPKAGDVLTPDAAPQAGGSLTVFPLPAGAPGSYAVIGSVIDVNHLPPIGAYPVGTAFVVQSTQNIWYKEAGNPNWQAVS